VQIKKLYHRVLFQLLALYQKNGIKFIHQDIPCLEENLKDIYYIYSKSYAMMLNFRTLLIPGILIILFLVSTGCTQAPAPAQTPAPTSAGTTIVPTAPAVSAAAPQNATKEEMVAFVQEAVAYAQQNGKDKALAEFSNRNGSFFRGVLYIYAYDYNGTTIAHPVNPEKIGVNRLNEKDAEGNLFIQDLRQAAYNGTGFTTYTYINPVHNNTVEKKLGYVMKVDDSWWLGSGIYIGPAQTPAPVTTTQPSQ
jgi:cytochrome c